MAVTSLGPSGLKQSFRQILWSNQCTCIRSRYLSRGSQLAIWFIRTYGRDWEGLQTWSFGLKLRKLHKKWYCREMSDYSRRRRNFSNTKSPANVDQVLVSTVLRNLQWHPVSRHGFRSRLEIVAVPGLHAMGIFHCTYHNSPSFPVLMFSPRPHHPILHSHASSPASSPFLISLRYANKPTFLASFSKSRRCQMWLLSMRWVILILLQIDLLLLTVKVKKYSFRLLSILTVFMFSRSWPVETGYST